MPGSQPYTWGRHKQWEDEELMSERVHVRLDDYWSGGQCWPPREIEELYAHLRGLRVAEHVWQPAVNAWSKIGVDPPRNFRIDICAHALPGRGWTQIRRQRSISGRCGSGRGRGSPWTDAKR